MIRDKIRENAQPLLERGEQIEEVFAAQTFNGWWAALSWLIVLFKNSYRAIVVTDKRIAVFNTGRWAMGTPKELLRSLPRSTRIGQPSGLWWKTESLGERMYIHKRFHKDVESADAKAR